MKKVKKNQCIRSLKIAFTIGIISLSGFINCSKDDLDNGACNNWSEKYLDKAAAYSQAANAYSNDPTAANCNTMKEKGLSYVKALEGIINCVPTINQAEFNKEIREVKAEFNNMDCDS
ncbi:hypothetical protein MWU59_13820 [Flavobacteriaceae bacterium F08102]|nr:hypothetical protein [Flavobacteriaceae bacterium F08102]